jgi:hypothetical protein
VLEAMSGIPRRAHQGQFGEDYVRVLATAAGLTVASCNLDVDGIDLQITLPDDVGSVRSPRIEVQVKTASRLQPVDGVFAFDGLNGWQFNKLAGPGFMVPRYLFLVTVPVDASRYVDLNHEGLLLRHIGYWTSLHSRDVVPAARSSVRVKVPIANVLTARRLRELVEAAR